MMKAVRLLASVALGTLVFAAGASAAPPRAGVLVPARSLGGLRLDATQGQVRAAWGARHGVCRDCSHPTWYFNFRPFEPQGTGVAFRQGRAVALFTMWGPQAWRTNRGLGVGDPAVRVAGIYGPLLRVSCGTYYALTMQKGKTRTSIYVVDEQVWGFGLSRLSEPVCR
jgi:hypothetical protein